MIQKLNDIHFTSNLHFRHKDVAIARGFNNVEEMEISLIDKWNTQIKQDDTVYILGGFCSIVKGALQSYQSLVKGMPLALAMGWMSISNGYSKQNSVNINLMIAVYSTL